MSILVSCSHRCRTELELINTYDKGLLQSHLPFLTKDKSPDVCGFFVQCEWGIRLTVVDLGDWNTSIDVDPPLFVSSWSLGEVWGAKVSKEGPSGLTSNSTEISPIYQHTSQCFDLRGWKSLSFPSFLLCYNLHFMAALMIPLFLSIDREGSGQAWKATAFHKPRLSLWSTVIRLQILLLNGWLVLRHAYKSTKE